mgnify:CR=1 FL=1|tara:strand:- start:311 stop:658 length:348 start_codon:yes stop_codon:yes gene_type:complete
MNISCKRFKEIETFFNDRVQEIKDYDADDLDVKIRNGELHHEIFNTDYYIIGTYKAEQWLGVDAFNAIRMIQDYELENFGVVYTDLSNAEQVVNMFVYIVGESLVAEYVGSLAVN